MVRRQSDASTAYQELCPWVTQAPRMKYLEVVAPCTISGFWHLRSNWSAGEKPSAGLEDVAKLSVRVSSPQTTPHR